MEAPGYDPSVSTHKASSISSTSTASTWDYPLSNFSGNEDTLDDSIIQNASCFEDYQFGSTIERVSFPELETTTDYSMTKKQKDLVSKAPSDREEKFFASFIASSSAIEELPELASPLASSTATARLIEQTKQQNSHQEARIPEKERDCHEAESPFNIENKPVTKADLFSPILPYPEPIALVQSNDEPFKDESTNSRKRRSNCAISKHSSNLERPIQPKSTTAEEIPSETSDSVTSSNSKRSKPNNNRDGLTEDEKRANHIVSEQKRRNAIRTGFKDLTDIVPTLKNINNSKSTILFKAVEYIRHLDKRNRGLKEKIASLRVRMDVEERYRSSPSRAHQLFLNRYNNSNSTENYTTRNDRSRRYESNYSGSNNNNGDLHHLPAHTVSALIAHKNQQRQLELLQEQLRVQQQLLAKHNIIPATNAPDSPISLGAQASSSSQMRPHFSYSYSQPTQYNSILIPSNHHDDNNKSVQSMMKGKFIQSNTAALIVPQDEDDSPWRPSNNTEHCM